MMSSSRQDQSDSPPLCARNCGFFGNPATHNMCSKCYRAYLKEKQIALALSSGIPSQINISANNPRTPATTEEAPAPPPKKNNRCLCCNKRTGLTGFNCRCGGVFCGLHRYPEKHECQFDFKSLGRHLLVKQNPLIKAEKLDDRI